MPAYTILKETKLPQSEIEFLIKIEPAELEPYRTHALSHLGEHVSIPGFRKGHVPENVLISKVGELSLLEEMVEHALQDIVPNLISEKKIDALGRPSISITKLAPLSPAECKITFAIFPSFALPDYKSLSAKENRGKSKPADVSEKEIEDVIENIRKNFASKDAKESENKTGNKTLPELDDALVKKLGDFKDKEDFKVKLKKNMENEKAAREREKNRLKIVDALIKETEVDIPRVLIDQELRKMEAEYRGDLERMGAKFDDYLKHIKKTIEDVRKDWEETAKKRAKLELILLSIAEKEKISPDKEAVEKEVSHILEHHKDVNPDGARSYVEHFLTKEKIFEFLENQ